MRIANVFLVFFLFQANHLPQNSRLYTMVDSISNYIISDEFEKLKSNNSDIELIDSIYVFALRINDYNLRETLLSLTFATLPFNHVPITTPFIGVKIKYPLITSPQNVFLKKVEKMPGRFFYDTPDNDFGDKDKLAHFFGNAFVAYSLNFFELTSIIGYFVEVFEETLKVSKFDKRDIRANRLGELFGKQLSKNEDALPSKLFIIFNLQNIRY